MNFLTLDDGRKELYQWDTDRIATVTGQADEVHFSNLKYGKCPPVPVENGKVKIPDEVLQSGTEIHCWAYVGTVASGYTKEEQTFTVNKRPKPADYVYTPTEIKSFENLAKEVKEIIPVEVESALEEAKASGDFKGDKGDKGEKGETGTVTVDNEMSDESENPVQNKVVKAYIDKNGIKVLTAEQFPDGLCRAWELPDGIYLVDNPDFSFEVWFTNEVLFSSYDGLFFVYYSPIIDKRLISAFLVDTLNGKQNFIGIAVDKEGTEADESLGFFASQRWVEERLSALELAVADLTLGE